MKTGSAFGLVIALLSLVSIGWSQDEKGTTTASSGNEKAVRTLPAAPSPAKPARKAPLFSSEWLKQEFSEKIAITGSKTIGFHHHQVEGDKQSFNDQNYFGEGDKRVTDFTDLSISGKKVFGLFNFDWRWTNSRFGNPFDQRISLSYDTKQFKVEMGDITASIGGGNQLIAFTRSLKGVTLTTFLGNEIQLKYITSETKAAARTISIPGQDTSGPYYLQGSMIVDGSVRVRVDGREMQPGVDYRIDYDTGTLMFREGLIIPRISNIVVTYETYAYNSNVGKIDGWRLEMPLGKEVNLGFSLLSQTSKGGRGLRTRTERFYGRGVDPYDLDFPPLTDPAHPITVSVDITPLQPQVDFYLDPAYPTRLWIRRPVAPTSEVRITYTPRPDPGSTFGGDRKVYGMDLSLPLGRYGHITWNGARSQVANEGGTISGTAQVVNLDFRYGRLSLNASYNHIPPEYITVESVGFRRNEKSYRYDVNYDLASWGKLNWSVNRARVAAFSSFDPETGTSEADSTIQTFGLTLQRPNWPAMSLTRTVNTTSGAFGSTRQTNDILNLSKAWGRFHLSLDLNNIQARSVSTSLIGGNPTRRVVSYRISSTRLGAGWRVNDRLDINGVAALSRIEQSGQSQGVAPTSTRARDMSFSVKWQPLTNLDLRYEWSDSDSGITQNLTQGLSRQVGGGFNPPGFGNPGFTNGWGLGFNGNGFSSGAPYYGGFGSYGTRRRNQSLSVHWSPMSNLSLEAQFSQQRALGDFLTNSDYRTTAFSVSYNPADWLSLSGTWSRQNVKFLSNPGNSFNEYVFATVQLGPLRRWTFNINFQQMKSDSAYTDTQSQRGGLTQYAQNLRGMGIRADYAIGANQSLFADWSLNQILGYAASRDLLMTFGYEYRITRSLSFILSYRIREQKNLDPDFAKNSYRSRSFDAELAFRF